MLTAMPLQRFDCNGDVYAHTGDASRVDDNGEVGHMSRTQALTSGFVEDANTRAQDMVVPPPPTKEKLGDTTLPSFSRFRRGPEHRVTTGR